MSEDIHKYPSQLAERFQVRMPDGLRDKLKTSAEENSRSMNAEIVARLEESFVAQRSAAEVLEQAIITLEQENAERRRTLMEERAMLSQIKLMRYLLDRVAASGGHLDKDLWAAIAILSGQDEPEEGRPDADLAQLLQSTVDAIEAAEAFSAQPKEKL